MSKATYRILLLRYGFETMVTIGQSTVLPTVSIYSVPKCCNFRVRVFFLFPPAFPTTKTHCLCPHLRSCLYPNCPPMPASLSACHLCCRSPWEKRMAASLESLSGIRAHMFPLGRVQPKEAPAGCECRIHRDLGIERPFCLLSTRSHI